MLVMDDDLVWTMETFSLGCPVLCSPPSPCLEPKHTHVAFLKTHKTASSTMQNLLFGVNGGTALSPVLLSMHLHLQPYAPPHPAAQHHHARNTLTFDLGGEKARSAEDVGYSWAFVAEVEQAFTLGMIAEHFDESLVLQRHLLFWDLEADSPALPATALPPELPLEHSAAASVPPSSP
ncbi:unnamed protein product [Boreogadus saida]